MPRLALEHDILQHSVAAAVEGLRVRAVGLGNQLPLHDPGLSRLGADIVYLVPAHDVLPDRFAVKEDQGDSGAFRLIDDHRRRGAVDQD